MPNINTINSAVKAKYGDGAEFIKGGGYFYVTGTRETPSEPFEYATSQSIPIYSINEQTLEQWMDSVKQIYDDGVQEMYYSDKDPMPLLHEGFIENDSPNYPDSETERSRRDDILFEDNNQDTYKTGPEDIAFEQDNTLPGIDNAPIVDDEHSRSWRKELMANLKTAAKVEFEGQEYDATEEFPDIWNFGNKGYWYDKGNGMVMDSNDIEIGNGKFIEASMKTAAKENSLSKLNVKKQTPKRLFDKETNLAIIDREPDDSIYGDDKPLNRHIRNERGKIAARIELKHLQKGDSIRVAGKIKKIESVEPVGVIARDLFTGFDELLEGSSFFRTATVSAISPMPNPVKEKPEYRPFFRNASVKEGEELFPDEDDTRVVS